jgi:hypothetical protein
MKTLLAVALSLFVVSSLPAAAQDIRQQPVQFKKGASSATLKGNLKGDQIVDYKLRARAGQTMSVKMKSTNAGNYFNVLPPGSSDVAVYNSSIGGNDWSGALSADGEYTIRVYLVRSAARRGEHANYTLTVGITGGAAASTSAAADARGSAAARRAGEGSFDATGQIPCAQAKGQPMGQCNFGVARAGGGTAAVVVTRPDGRKRTIFFTSGKAVSADTSQADGYGEFRASKESDLFTIRVGDERYEIPEAVITGG